MSKPSGQVTPDTRGGGLDGGGRREREGGSHRFSMIDVDSPFSSGALISYLVGVGDLSDGEGAGPFIG